MKDLIENYKNMKIPDYMFHIDYKAFKKRIFLGRFIVASIITIIIINCCMIFAQVNLQKDISELKVQISKIQE